jgi:hypothetical protein
MKRFTTLFISPLILGAAIVLFGLRSIRWEALSIWRWCLIIAGVLVLGLVIGTLLNLAVFAPVYWLLGRLHLRRSQVETNHEHKTGGFRQRGIAPCCVSLLTGPACLSQNVGPHYEQLISDSKEPNKAR